MLNYTNKIERETQERSSNIELLRILSMFLVLMIHYIPSRTLPTHDTLAHDTLGTLFDLELRSISFVCVNCFILISGYFGIRWKLKSFSNLLFKYCSGRSYALLSYPPQPIPSMRPTYSRHYITIHSPAGLSKRTSDCTYWPR